MRSIRRLLYVLCAVTLIATGCGIPIDSEPEVIAADQLPEALQPGTSSTTTTLPPQLTENVTIFLVDPGDGVPTLQPVTRQAAVVDSGADLEFLILEQLFQGPTQEEQLDENLTTRLVPAVDDVPISVLDIRRPVEEQLVLVLSETPTLEGQDRTAAFGQIVFTLTELDETSQVRFMIRNEDGTDEDVPVKTDTEEGDVRRPVGREDYSTLVPVGGFS